MPGSGDFTEDEERPVGFDFHRHRRFADVAVTQPSADVGSEPGRRQAARRHRADQRHGDGAAGIDRIGVGETFLAIDHDAQLVAGIEPVLLIVSRARRPGINHPRLVADLRRRIGRRHRLPVGHGVKFVPRLHRRDRPGPAHAA